MASVAEPTAARAPEAPSAPLPATTGRKVDPKDSGRPKRRRRGTGGRRRGLGLSARELNHGRGFQRGRRAGASVNGNNEDPR